MNIRALISASISISIAVAWSSYSRESVPSAKTMTRGQIHCDATSNLCFRVDAERTTCGASKWVGQAPSGLCPEGEIGLDGHWYLDADRSLGTSSEYCRYEWQGEASPDAEALTVLSQRQGLASLEPDCEVVGVSARAIETTWPILEEVFYEQTERLSVFPAGQQPVAPVRVDVIDSAVTLRSANGEPSFGRLPHGRAMGLIIRRLACPGGGDSCRADVASTLALPIVDTPEGPARDFDNGGYYGSHFDLASAIDDAVDDWKENASSHRLVINLSLGWEADHGGTFVSSPNELSTPVRAVWDAIARSRCLGAVVIAATGNRIEGPDAPTGALYPAAWAKHTVVSQDECKNLGVTQFPTDYSENEAMVFAVGGVESNDADLGLARAGSRPELVAPAAHAVVADSLELPHSQLQTGTSVAAAVTSAVVAVVWSYRPELSAAEVVELVYEGGAALDRQAEICLGGASCARTTRRVSVCGALQEACHDGEGGCPLSPVVCHRQPGGRVARPSELPLPPTDTVSAEPVVFQTAVGWPCGGQLYSSQNDVANPCPASQFYGAPALAAVGPQPEKGPACPHCVFSPGTEELYIEIDPLVGEATNPVLRVVVDSNPADIRYFDLSNELPLLNGGDEATVTGLDIDSTTFESATIEFVVDGMYSDISAVLPM